MRIVSTRYLKEGDIIAKDIMSYGGGILLRRNTRFKEVFKAKLIERNITEVYIEDEVSAGIEPTEILCGMAKRKICHDIKKQFSRIQENLVIDMDTMKVVTHFLMEQLERSEMILELDDLKVNDGYTYEHCIAVAILVNLVCDKINMKAEQKEQTVMGALLHDIGKIIIPKDILNKPGELSPEEYEVIKTHAEIGYNMVKGNLEVSAITKLAILCHHEREDGTGYPLGKDDTLHISAKIVAACDLFHALISDRCYRQGLTIAEAIAIADKQPINAYIRTIIESSFCYYPVGSMVILSNGSLAIVEKNFAMDIKKPLVRLIEKRDKKYISFQKVDLREQEKLYIVSRYERQI